MGNAEYMGYSVVEEDLYAHRMVIAHFPYHLCQNSHTSTTCSVQGYSYRLACRWPLPMDHELHNDAKIVADRYLILPSVHTSSCMGFGVHFAGAFDQIPRKCPQCTEGRPVHTMEFAWASYATPSPVFPVELLSRPAHIRLAWQAYFQMRCSSGNLIFLRSAFKIPLTAPPSDSL